MPHPVPLPFDIYRIDLALCSGEFRRGATRS
jgi:hypothetical protein